MPVAPARVDEPAPTPAPESLRDAAPAGSLMPAPSFSVPVPPSAPSTSDPAAAERPSAAPAPLEAERLINLWKARPNEARSRRAHEIAGIANRVAAAYPGDPRVAAMTATLPAYLRAQASGALDRAEPLSAVLYFRAYRMLDFAPPDPELERRIEKARPAGLPAERRGPPQPTPGGG